MNHARCRRALAMLSTMFTLLMLQAFTAPVHANGPPIAGIATASGQVERSLTRPRPDLIDDLAEALRKMAEETENSKEAVVGAETIGHSTTDVAALDLHLAAAELWADEAGWMLDPGVGVTPDPIYALPSMSLEAYAYEFVEIANDALTEAEALNPDMNLIYDRVAMIKTNLEAYRESAGL